MSDCRPHDIRGDAFSYYPKLGRLAEFCEQNYREEITLRKAASLVNLERTYFCTYFHDKVGVCFSCWLSIVRVERAKKYLQNGSHAISVVANKAGFQSISTFERTFKRCTSMSASEYRKHVRPC